MEDDMHNERHKRFLKRYSQLYSYFHSRMICMSKCLTMMILAMWSCGTCVGQELVTVRDTINHFEIGVPVGWRYGVPVDKSVEFVAFREIHDEQDVARDNFNINIIRVEETDLNRPYSQFLESIGKAEGFKILDQGEMTVKNRKYKYLVETHKNPINKMDLVNYVLFTNKEGEVLILTMVTASKKFEKVKALFDSIGQSLNY